MWHIAAIAAGIAIAVIRFVAYIDDDKRWRRFLFLVFLLMAAAALAGW